MRGISMMVFLLLNLFCLHETTIARPESISLLKPLFCNDYIASKVDQFQTTLCPPPDNSNFVTIKSLKEYNTALENLEDKRLPGILYFTSEWCLSCKSLLSPFLKEESNKYSDVTTYKIDVDEEDLESVLSQLRISSVINEDQWELQETAIIIVLSSSNLDEWWSGKGAFQQVLCTW
ncbi:thioredoxin O1, mitochondrial-like isoform X2 [Mercurialis annua]|uniref:thioredoxin O1, mitochondrial-like isoform X2 n=1 Tax=Mercurialis annua TaxID=3986 RepID=UPI00215E3DE7|nr:thioredoxin O1, mitochondrial-like isoform X2 [Mercurialis annua]